MPNQYLVSFHVLLLHYSWFLCIESIWNLFPFYHAACNPDAV